MIEFPTGLNSQTPADNSQMLCADSGNVAGKFTLSALWTWISNKISAIFASDVTFGGNVTVGNSVYVNANVECDVLEATQIISTGGVNVTTNLTVTGNTTVGGDVSVTGNISTANGSVTADSVTASTSAIVRQGLTVGLHDPAEIQIEGDAYGEILANSLKLELWNNLGADGKGTEVQILPYFDENAGQDDEQSGVTIIITNKESNTPYQFDITAAKLTALLASV